VKVFRLTIDQYHTSEQQDIPVFILVQNKTFRRVPIRTVWNREFIHVENAMVDGSNELLIYQMLTHQVKRVK